MPTARSSRRCSRPSLATPRRPEKQGICSVPPQIKSSRSPQQGQCHQHKDGTENRLAETEASPNATNATSATIATNIRRWRCRASDARESRFTVSLGVSEQRSPHAADAADAGPHLECSRPCEIGWSAPGSLPASVNVLYVLRGARPLADGGNTGSRPNPSLWLPHPLGLRRVWLVLTRSPVPEGSTRSGS